MAVIPQAASRAFHIDNLQHTLNSRYHSDIQALRALAVSLVVVFHIAPDFLPGGFIGVDVFFVISGYLITRNLLAELTKDGLSATRFWARRVRRILPAAFVSLIFSFVLVFAVLPGALWQSNFSGILSSALFLQNWHLVLVASDYLEADRGATLVQHYWSLAVEEQFYILLPLLLIAMSAGVKTKMQTTTSAAILLVLVFVLSLAYSIIESGHSKALAYFSTFTRGWEFVAGALLLFFRPTSAYASTELRTLLCGLGFLIIFLSAFIFGTNLPFPGYVAVLPVFGALLVIYSQSDDTNGRLTTLTSLPPVQWLGDASYSVYLYHWPLVVAMPFLLPEASEMVVTSIIITATLALGFLSRRYVESPFLERATLYDKPPRFWFAFAVGGVALVCLVVLPPYISMFTRGDRGTNIDTVVADAPAAIKETLALPRWPAINEFPGESAQASEWRIDHCLSVDVGDKDAEAKCTYGPQGAARSIALIGDSWAIHFLPALRAGLPDWRIHVLTLGQCPIAEVPVRLWDRADEFTRCREHRTKVLARLRTLRVDLIVASDANYSTLRRLISGNTGAAALEELRQGYRSTYSELAILPTPTLVLESPPRANCLLQVDAAPAKCTTSELTTYERKMSSMKLGVAEELGMKTIDTTSLFCTAGLICPNQVGNFLIKADTEHISEKYSRALGPPIASEIESMF